ncbi:MAG: hypothetical protein MK137_09725 [Rickettsiales bacterium]|nr:hypothetical protein [Rickettsiales bacterium]
MASLQKGNMMNQDRTDHNENYSQLMKMYDFAEELVDTVSSDQTHDPAAQLEVVEPLIEEIETVTDLISTEYREFALKKKKTDLLTKKNIENALRTLYLSILKCRENARGKLLIPSEQHAGAGQKMPPNPLIRILDKLTNHLDQVLSLLRHSMNVQFKDHHYGRSGRQEGNSLSIASKKQEPNQQSNPSSGNE